MLDIFGFSSNSVNHEICLDNNPNQHPTMAEVVVGLDSVATLQENVKIENSVGVEAVDSKDSMSPREEETTTMDTTATINQVEDEWIEQFEPGVYLNLVLLNDGTRDIKRVRFSLSRRFGEHQAETWWLENRKQVYERYNVRGPMLNSHAS
ncbi:hypothetical protein L1887_38798 [Cichorium endivia]|nr:hypothetical protein L1887_38798 [Cichorium endivia]